MEELIKYGRIREFTTGIYADPNMEEGRPGATVAGVDKGSPGDKAGLRPGDILYEVAGKRINTLQDIQDVFKLFQVGESWRSSTCAARKSGRHRSCLRKTRSGESSIDRISGAPEWHPGRGKAIIR